MVTNVLLSMLIYTKINTEVNLIEEVSVIDS